MARHQVFDIPPPKVVVTEHQVLTVRCLCCGKETKAAAPKGAEKPVQYGPNILGLGLYLHAVHLLPCDRTAQIIQVVTGAPFSPGSLDRTVSKAHTCLADFDQNLESTLATVPVKHVDETGARVAGKLHWFHVRSNESMCRIFHHEKRGGVATGDLQSYQGVLVSDYFSSYVSLPCCTHVFCGAHLLRELRFVKDVLGQPWAGFLFGVLEMIVHECHRARARGQTKVRRARRLASNFDWWVKEGLKANSVNAIDAAEDADSAVAKSGSSSQAASPKARCLAKRLSERRDDYLRFLFDLSLPFTNNRAEQDIRMLKVKQKISGSFRTDTGADMFCRIRSYTATCRRQGMNLLECLKSVCAGRPILPSLQPA